MMIPTQNCTSRSHLHVGQHLQSVSWTRSWARWVGAGYGSGALPTSNINGPGLELGLQGRAWPRKACNLEGDTDVRQTVVQVNVWWWILESVRRIRKRGDFVGEEYLPKEGKQMQRPGGEGTWQFKEARESLRSWATVREGEERMRQGGTCKTKKLIFMALVFFLRSMRRHWRMVLSWQVMWSGLCFKRIVLAGVWRMAQEARWQQEAWIWGFQSLDEDRAGRAGGRRVHLSGAGQEDW